MFKLTVAGVIAGLALLSGSALEQAPAGAAPTNRAAVTCPARSLHFQVSSVEGSAGTFLIHLLVRTTSARCDLYGYPKVRIIGTAGPLPTHLRHGGLAILNRPVRHVVLTKSRPAELLVSYNAVPSGGERSCPTGSALTVDGVRVDVITRACRGGTLLESPYVAA